MMKRFSQLAILSLLCLLLSGCGARADSGPVSVSATQGDFKVTFTSAHSVYDSGSLDPEAPLDLEIQVEYLGREKELTISRGAFMGPVYLHLHSAEDAVPMFPVESIGYIDTLRFDEPYVETHTGAMEYEYLGGLPTGVYTATAHVSFGLLPSGWTIGADMEYIQQVDLNFELPFEIR